MSPRRRRPRRRPAAPTKADAEATGVYRPGSVADDRTIDHTGSAGATDHDLTIDDPRASKGLPRGATIQYFGDYELQKELGRGGMGVVYKAVQVSLNRPVAIKMIKAGVLADAAELQRFQNEAEAVALLDHAGIVPVYEVGEHNGQRYFSMKLVEGGNLANQLATMKTNPGAAATLLAKTAEAVHHAHMRGILHRDLKPANILVDPEGHPHVTDFGLAKRVEGDIEMTLSGAILGTPAYMSPEQAIGRRGSITTASDVYGLGAILYALLAGKAPFGGDSVMDTLDAVRTRPPEPPRKFNPNTPLDLETICLKCLEKDPRRRYASAHELASDLTNWLESRPITARRVGATERACLWCKRKPAIAGLAAAVVLAVVFGTGAVIVVQTGSNRALGKKNGELQSTNAKLEKQRARSEEREKQAIDAVNRFGKAVGTEPALKNSADLAELRKRLMKEPLAFFKDLRDSLQADGDTRPESLERLAQASFDLGTLANQIGDKRDALIAHRESLAIRQKLADANPIVSKYRGKLADSLNRVGHLHGEAARQTEALAAFRSELAIRRELVADHPTVAEYRSGEAFALDSLGGYLAKFGKPDDALAAYRSSLAIARKLVAEYPSDANYQTQLAACHGNLAVLLREMYGPADSLEDFRSALAIQQKLSAADPESTFIRNNLFAMHMNIARTLELMGNKHDALESVESALKIGQKLAEDNPTVTDFQRRLANVYSAIGGLTESKPVESMKAQQAALTIRLKLVKNHPGVPDFESEVGGVLNNMARVHLYANEFVEARARLREAITWQRKALASNPANPTYRQFLGAHMRNLLLAAQRLGDSDTEAEANRELDLLGLTDPVKKALDERLAAIIAGKPRPTDQAELLKLAQRAHEKALHATATGFWAEALATDPKLGDDRKAQHRYYAASDAARAAGGKGRDDPKPDDDARAKLRAQALGWLKAELSAWKRHSMTAEPGNKDTVARAMTHWKANVDFASIHDEAELAKLPEAERKEWQSLWAEVESRLKRLEGGKP
jgi:tetratricopeptide (TPR) repeat protein